MSILSKIKNLVRYYQECKPRPINVVNVTLSSNNMLAGRTALVTGGTSGIGFEIAKTFISSGATVYITGRSEERLVKAVERIKRDTQCSGSQIKYVELDVSNVDAIDQIFSQLTDKERIKFDILVNNAGVGSETFGYATKEDFDRTIDTNLRGSYFLAQNMARFMMKNHIEGNILNIASSSSLRPANSAYMLSKWGIRGLTVGLAKMLAPHGITVNGIAPGPTATPMLLKEGDSIELKNSALGRYILPEEIANMAVVLVSPLGKSVVGDIIYMTGGAGVITFDDINYNLEF